MFHTISYKFRKQLRSNRDRNKVRPFLPERSFLSHDASLSDILLNWRSEEGDTVSPRQGLVFTTKVRNFIRLRYSKV